MKSAHVLIINNESAHLDKLQEMIAADLAGVEISVCGTRDYSEDAIKAADLIIFSGGSKRSIEKNPQTFRRMVAAVVKHKKPAIGICLGAEAIAVYYGGNLRRMLIRRVGNIPVTLTEEFNKESGLKERVRVYEFHRWLIDTAPDPLEILATSKDGIELFRHKKLPIWGMQFHPEVRRLNNSGHLIFAYILRQVGCL